VVLGDRIWERVTRTSDTRTQETEGIWNGPGNGVLRNEPKALSGDTLSEVDLGQDCRVNFVIAISSFEHDKSASEEAFCCERSQAGQTLLVLSH
jgi:hypothetical protein